MASVIITSDEGTIIPTSVQNEIRNRFSLSDDKNVIVKFDIEEGDYGIYQNINGIDEYLFTLDHDGNEI